MKRIVNCIILLALLPLGACAQKKAKKSPQPKEPVVEVTQESINFDNLLPSTAKIIFVDSIVTQKQSFTKNIALAKSAGVVSAYKKDTTMCYTYTNSLNNLRILSQPDKNGHSKLYRQTKKGAEWGEPEQIVIPGDFTDLICPYMLTDGSTLYFSARGGEDNVGGYDLFFTFYDNDEEKFITPQSIGLPFNSNGDDLYYIIDEDTNIGYLVTDRRQKKDKVCIYSFIPTESRETYNTDDEEQLRNYAILNSIAKTQTDKKAVADARKRMKTFSTSSKQISKTISFPIRKGVIYSKASDFRNAKAREMFATYSTRMQTLMEQEERLTALRSGYHKGQKYTADEILQLEKTVENERTNLRNLGAEIRNIESGNNAK